MNVIFDCDNTFGVSGCDVDDGLALLYLLGSGNVNLLGITSTYGNSDIETVYAATKKMLRDLGRSDIPLLKGCAGAEPGNCEAVDFLVNTVDRLAGNVSILATGSLTNLRAAYEKDADFFDKINEISLMGGVTEPLIINGRRLNELNFSCDPTASCLVLNKGRQIGIATGNNCLNAYFSREEYERRLSRSEADVARYIYDNTAYWYEHNQSRYGQGGFYNWDVVAAAYLLNKDYFYKNDTVITPDLTSLNEGFLCGTGSAVTVALPKIRNPQEFENHVYETYRKADGA